VGYRLLDSSRYIAMESGKTISLSSKGALFETATQLPVGKRVELFISWPAKFDAIFPIRLVAQGRVLRSTPSRAVVSLVRHEFRIDVDRLPDRKHGLEMQGFVN
jgi:hypothetical protein